LQGLATLLILDDLLKAIAANPGNRHGKPRPCDVFDMIGGIGVGGWLALLLGRFHLDIATCIQVYVEIVRSVMPKSTKEKYQLRWHNASYNQDRLLNKIRQLTAQYGTGKYMIYENREKGPRCQFA
jgi:patatin-like phospholipase/acyl hydrolase